MTRSALLSEHWEGKDTDAIITDMLRLQGKNTREISRLLDIENHEELIKLLDDFLQKCKEIVKTKKHDSRSTTDEYQIISQVLPKELDILSPVERELFENLHKKLFSLTRDSKRFLAELAKIHHRDLPTNPDAWIFWSTNFPELLGRLGAMCRLKTTGDESIIAGYILENIIPELYKNPEFLIQSPQQITVHGRVITLASILDIYKYIGEGGYQVLVQILSKIKILSTPRISQNTGDVTKKESPLNLSRTLPTSPNNLGNNQSLAPILSRVQTNIRIHRQGDPMSSAAHVAVLPKKLQEIISQLNGYFSRNDSSLTLETGDLFLNSFGGLCVSGAMEKEKLQEIIKALDTLSLSYKISGENRV